MNTRTLILANTHSSNKGFTLIELLVVITVLALLMSIMVPALQRARHVAHSTICLSNLRQLQVLWFLYADDNDGKMVSAHTGPGGVHHPDEMGWVDWDWGLYNNSVYVSEERQRELVRNGRLYPYTDTEEIYQCSLRLPDAVNQPIFRTYAIVDSMNGFNQPHREAILTRRDEIRSPSQRIGFVGKGYTSYSSWSVPEVDNNLWWAAVYPVHSIEQPNAFNNDYAPNHHQKGITFSLLDGSAGRRRWEDDRTLGWEFPIPSESPYQRDNVDLQWVKRAIWGERLR